jgi:hypothetical protein
MRNGTGARRVLAGLVAATIGSAAAAQEPPRLVVLNPQMPGALAFAGGVSVRVRSGAHVNSVDPAAVRGSGSGVVVMPELVVCGGVDFVGGRTLSGLLTAGADPCEDPLLGLEIPGLSGMPGTGGTVVISGGSCALSPGEYPAGLRIQNGATVTLAPGTYIFGGSGLSLTSGSLSGAGVTLVMAQGSLSLVGKAQLAAPDAGALAGVVVCQPASNAGAMALSGSSGTVLYGAVYAPGAAVALAGVADGGSGPLMGRMLVADSVKAEGSGWVRIGEEP